MNNKIKHQVRLPHVSSFSFRQARKTCILLDEENHKANTRCDKAIPCNLFTISLPKEKQAMGVNLNYKPEEIQYLAN